MKCILIADGGSTKCAWYAAPCRQGDGFSFTTPGFNAAVSSDDEINNAIAETASRLKTEGMMPEKIFFYGAGCGSPSSCIRVTTLLNNYFPEAPAEADSDLLGAARALFGNAPGIACILGTGSNSGLYDGSVIIYRVPPLGFILGDEGSGAYLGKELLKAVFRRTLPSEIITRFETLTGLTEAEAITRVYRMEAPNRFLASLAPFLKENIDTPEVASLVRNSFVAFRTTSLEHYRTAANTLLGEASSAPVGIVGSIAFHFKAQLAEALSPMSVRVLKAPREELARFHTGRR